MSFYLWLIKLNKSKFLLDIITPLSLMKSSNHQKTINLTVLGVEVDLKLSPLLSIGFFPITIQIPRIFLLY